MIEQILIGASAGLFGLAAYMWLASYFLDDL